MSYVHSHNGSDLNRTQDAQCKMTNKKPGCFFPFFPCLYPLDSDDLTTKRHSDDIDKWLQGEKMEFVKTHRLLLLGAGESGKSTVIKQMQLIHGEKFSEGLRRQRRDDIRNNLLEAIASIVRAMGSIEPPVQLDSAEHETMAKWVVEYATKQGFDYPSEFYQYTKVLWKDRGVQATFERSNEYQLIDSAKYFLDRVDEISRDDYRPTDQDILRCRVLTTGISEINFQVEDAKFQIIDVGGQRDERRKWFMCFNDVTAIIFITACSSYNMVLREDPTKNRLIESLELFKRVWKSKFLGHISVILFLNKQDLFREKILSGRSKLEDYFPSYTNFKSEKLEPNEHPEINKAKQFIKLQFEKISMTSNRTVDHRFFSHYTCAVDTENIKRVFDACREVVQIKNLLDYDLI
ncbi:guanine nucleotide-binding protein G(s) subunit alpha-like isoform X2 [Zophobas morio]|uniref:guanine nucleotide-binding protein G(s) subunit alpha-like isoform X2 n=1 Tax=Zophobas morio TaxID=2755281 RepID=UPI003083AFB2